MPQETSANGLARQAVPRPRPEGPPIEAIEFPAGRGAEVTRRRRAGPFYHARHLPPASPLVARREVVFKYNTKRIPAPGAALVASPPPALLTSDNAAALYGDSSP